MTTQRSLALLVLLLALLHGPVGGLGTILHPASDVGETFIPSEHLQAVDRPFPAVPPSCSSPSSRCVFRAGRYHRPLGGVSFAHMGAAIAHPIQLAYSFEIPDDHGVHLVLDAIKEVESMNCSALAKKGTEDGFITATISLQKGIHFQDSLQDEEVEIRTLLQREMTRQALLWNSGSVVHGLVDRFPGCDRGTRNPKSNSFILQLRGAGKITSWRPISDLSGRSTQGLQVRVSYMARTLEVAEAFENLKVDFDAPERPQGKTSHQQPEAGIPAPGGEDVRPIKDENRAETQDNDEVKDEEEVRRSWIFLGRLVLKVAVGLVQLAKKVAHIIEVIDTITQVLRNGADWDKEYGFGLLNVNYNPSTGKAVEPVPIKNSSYTCSNCWFTFGAGVRFSLHVAPRGVVSLASVSTFGTVAGEVELEANPSAWWTAAMPPLERPLFAFSLPTVTIYVGPLPVRLDLSIPLYLTVNANASASVMGGMKLRASVNGTVEFGTRYQAATGFSSIHNRSLECSGGLGHVGIQGDVGVRVGLLIVPRISVDLIASIDLGINNYVDMIASFSLARLPNACGSDMAAIEAPFGDRPSGLTTALSMDYGIDLTIGSQFHLYLSWVNVKIERKFGPIILWSQSWPLYAGCATLFGGPSSSPALLAGASPSNVIPRRAAMPGDTWEGIARPTSTYCPDFGLSSSFNLSMRAVAVDARGRPSVAVGTLVGLSFPSLTPCVVQTVFDIVTYDKEFGVWGVEFKIRPNASDDDTEQVQYNKCLDGSPALALKQLQLLAGVFKDEFLREMVLLNALCYRMDFVRADYNPNQCLNQCEACVAKNEKWCYSDSLEAGLCTPLWTPCWAKSAQTPPECIVACN